MSTARLVIKAQAFFASATLLAFCGSAAAQTESEMAQKIFAVNGEAFKDQSGRVTTVVLRNTDKSLDGIDLRVFSKLKSIEISEKLTDHTLARLESIAPDLTEFKVQFSPITDDALAAFVRNHKSLRIVTLVGTTKITDKALVELGKLENLDTLFLVRVNITDKGLKHIVNAPLQFLSLGRTDVSDGGMKDIAKLRGLKHLSLNNTKLTDVGMQDLTGLNNLVLINLNSTKVTDTGKAVLSGSIPNLRFQKEIEYPEATKKRLKDGR